MRHHRQAPFRAYVLCIPLRPDHFVAFGTLDGHTYTGIEPACTADFFPSWFKFRLFLQWHKELLGEGFDRSRLGFLLSLNCQPKPRGGKAKRFTNIFSLRV